MNRSTRIKESLVLLLVISIGGHSASPIDGSTTETWINLSSIGGITTEDAAAGTTAFDPPTSRLPTEEAATGTEISKESQTTIDTIVSEETIVYNRFATAPSRYEEYTTVDEDPDERRDHDEEPYSDHEEAKEISTRPNYTGPGTWAKPPKDKKIPLEFVPTKLYAQVRGTHTVKRLPQEEARKSAQSDEEKENASRLRQVVKNSKVNTVYTEEGYEDSAYDHAGHIRDADFHEGYARKLHDQTDVKKNAKVPEGNRDKNRRKTAYKKQKEFEDYDEDYSDHYESTTARMDLKKLPQNQRIVEEIDPKLVTENGIEELERDLEEEVTAVEKGLELKRVANTDTRKNSSSNKKDGKTSIESNEDFSRERPESIDTINTNIYNVNSGPHESGQVSPYVHSSILEVPTTVDYGQIFWDFMKSQDQGLTTHIPLQEALTPVPAIGDQNPYYSHDSSLVKNLAAAPSLDYTSSTFGENSWRPLSASEALGSPQVASSYTINNMLSTLPTKASESEAQNISGTKIEESSEEAGHDNPFDPSTPLDTNTGINFRPRYKMLVRHKPKKGNVNRIKQSIEPPARNPNSNNKHAKVLNYIRNEDLPRHGNGYKQKDNSELDDLGNARPQYPPRLFGVPFAVGRPSITLESESLPETNWQKPQGQQYSDLNDFNKQLSLYQCPFPISEPMILTRERASFPSTKLMPPAPLTSNDYAKYQPRNFVPKFRSVAYDGTRQFGRKRRSIGEFELANVKAAAKSSDSNRQSRKRRDAAAATTRSARTGRNSRRKARDTLMGREVVLETAGKKLGLHTRSKNLSVKSLPKHSGELIIERESSVANDPKNGGKKRATQHVVKSHSNGSHSVPKETVSVYMGKVKRDTINRSTKRRKTHQELLDESPRITNQVIDKEIETRFNAEDERDKGESDEGKKGKVEVEVPDFDYVEELEDDDRLESTSTTAAPLDTKKYPFYKDDRISSPALKYAIDPKQTPRKTAGGMEFYRSRDKYKECSEVEPSLDQVLPEEEEPNPDKGLKENLPRLRGLGDKLDCFKAKYFDDNPFDNPLFAETKIEEPTRPIELDPKGFASRIMVLPEENEDYVIQKLSKRPEPENFSPRNPNYSQPTKVSNSQTLKPSNSLKERKKNTHHNRARTRNRPSGRRSKQRLPFTIVGRPRVHPAKSQISNRRPLSQKPEKPYSNTIRMQESRNPPVFPTTQDRKIYYSNPQQTKDIPFKSESNLPSKIVKENRVPVSVSEPFLYLMTPYESQVYEDVMGNIRNMAISYKVHEDLESPAENVQVTIPNKTEIKTVAPPLKYHKKGNQGDALDITKSSTAIEDPIPSQNSKSYPRTLKRNRSHQDIRAATKNPLVSPRVIGHYQTIRIHKRSVGNEMQNPNDEYFEQSKDLINSSPAESDLVAGESINIRTRSNNKDTSTPFPEQRTTRRRTILRNDSSDDSSLTGNAENKKQARKAAYTARGSIRHSKPQEEVRGVGKFSDNETLIDEDHRRKEPRYNRSRSRTVPTEQITSSTSATTQILPSKEQSQEVERTEEYDHSGEILRITPKRHPDKNSSRTRTKARVKSYAVHERIDEKDNDAPMTTMESIHEKYLSKSTMQNDSPRIQSKKTVPTRVDTSEETERGGPEIKNESGSSEDDSSVEKKSSDEDKTFFWYDSRPSSPAENYEDDKYTDLGPRISKPRFHHPRFFVPRHEKLGNIASADNSEDEDERKSEESGDGEDDVFPWFRDTDRYTKDIRESRFQLDTFEFPWERRERLMKKQKQNKKSKLKKLNIHDDDGVSEDSVSEEGNYGERTKGNGKGKGKKSENQDAMDDYEESDDSVSRSHSEYVYPWDRSRSKNRSHRRNAWKNSEADSESSNSDIRPVMKYSSRYSTRSKESHLDGVEEPLVAATNSAEEIKQSENQTIKSTETTDSPLDQTSVISTTENEKNSRGISRGMIVPEDVTLAPMRKAPQKPDRKNSTESLRNRSEIVSKRSKSKKYGTDLRTNDTEMNINRRGATTENSRRRRRPSTLSSSSAPINSITKTSTESPAVFKRRPRRRPNTTTVPSSIYSVLTTATPEEAEKQTAMPEKREKGNITIAIKIEPRNPKADDVPTTKRATTRTSEGKHRSRTTRMKIASSTISPDKEMKERAKENKSPVTPSKRIRTTVIRRKITKPEKEVRSNIESPKKIPDQGEKDDGKANRSTVIERHEVKMIYSPVSSTEDTLNNQSSTRVTTLDSVAMEDKAKDDANKENAVKSGVNLSPTNGVVKLSEHSSRESVSSVSWISEKYTF